MDRVVGVTLFLLSLVGFDVSGPALERMHQGARELRDAAEWIEVRASRLECVSSGPGACLRPAWPARHRRSAGVRGARRAVQPVAGCRPGAELSALLPAPTGAVPVATPGRAAQALVHRPRG